MTATTTGKNLYALVYNTLGQVYNGSSFETSLAFATNFGRYIIPCVETVVGNGIYNSLLGMGLPSGVYTIVIKVMTGTYALVSDTVVETQTISWNGSSRVSILNALGLSNYIAFGKQ